MYYSKMFFYEKYSLNTLLYTNENNFSQNRTAYKKSCYNKNLKHLKNKTKKDGRIKYLMEE